MSHTPGPWATDDDGYIIAPGRGLIGYPARVPDSDERGPNARLMGAAPELLAALEALLDAIEDQRVTHGDCNQGRAAIAKARGSQS